MSNYFDDIANALRADFDTRFTTAGVTKVFENVPAVDPPTEAQWVRYAFRPGTSEREVITGDVDTGQLLVGVVIIQLFTPSGTSTGAAWATANIIRDLYNESKVVVAKTGGGNYTNDVRFFNPSVEVIGSGTRDIGGEWYQLNVTCPFEHAT